MLTLFQVSQKIMPYIVKKITKLTTYGEICFLVVLLKIINIYKQT